MTRVPAPGTRAPRARPVDWTLAAELLASGRSLTETARRVGCSRARLARRVKTEPDLTRWTAEPDSTAPWPEPRRDRIAGLRETLHDAIEAEVRNGNVRVILWLADRLKLITPPDERTPEQELQALLHGLGPDELKEFEGLQDDPPSAS